MEQNDVDIFIMQKGNFFPEDKVGLLREQLLSAENLRLENLLMVKLKDSLLALIISIVGGIFGADRFYLHESVAGICKLSLTLAVYVLALISNLQINPGWGIVIALWVGMLAMWIWYFIDLSRVSRKVRELNYKSLLIHLN